MAKLNDMVREFRESIKQSVEGLALLLQITPDEYRALEKDWIPSDEFLHQLCALFEWNYNDIKRIAQNSAGRPNQKTAPVLSGTGNAGKKDFHQMLVNARNKVGQPPIAIATLLNISEDYYLSFENNVIPPEDLLKRICSLFSWNYIQVKRMLYQQTSPRMVSVQPPLSLKTFQSKMPQQAVIPGPAQQPVSPETFANRLYQGRIDSGQPAHAIALLLNIDLDHYQNIENGASFPDKELLRKIAALFRWNFRELELLLHNENIQAFQPSVVKRYSNESDGKLQRLHQLQAQIEDNWTTLSSEQQEMILIQLETLKTTILQLATLQNR
ncbi:MAG: hypothetical protein HQM12_09140 [SAR324 cluster bacterium]|nr:hypothetical protein [SAR324 cluster bacterium]